jgi:hypothetical protein
MEQLISRHPKINHNVAAAILRNQNGLNEKNIGITNEKNINQLIAHHAVIFKPHERLVWISTQPFQCGQFICYDLKKVFAQHAGLKTKKEIYERDLSVPPDTFLLTPAYNKFINYTSLKKIIIARTGKDSIPLPGDMLINFIKTNPECYASYQTAGDYYKSHDNYPEAIHYYSMGLNKEIATKQEADKMFRDLSACISAWRRQNKK